jgi:triacylglycerol esterase/lipase EstA (alpha/beta hydrolase family)
MKLQTVLSVLILSASLLLAASHANAASTSISSRPILFIHGFNPFGLGEDCKDDWAIMETALRAQGFTGPMSTLGYYFDDPNCDVMTSPHGSILTPIQDLAKDLAWSIYNSYSSQGVSVDVVAHSMGGLMTRYALYRIAVGDTSYPPFLKIAHVATLGTPYTGYSLTAESCHIVAVNVECWQMFPLSFFIADLKNSQALLPQGQGGTTWSNVGSNADILELSDGFVGSASATSMEIPDSSKMIMPWYKFVFHTMYTHNATVIASVASSLSDGIAQSNVVPQIVTSTPDVTPNAVVSQNEVVLDMSTTPQNRRPARAEPYLENNQVQGVKFTEVLPDGIFAKMGIENGDVVRGCTEETRGAPFDALAQLETSSQPVTLDFCVLRNGIESHKVVRVQ